MTSKLYSPYFQLTFKDFLTQFNDFEILVDWLSNEFILYQQEKNQNIKVYFPNGCFVVSNIEECENEIEVYICSKSRFTFNKIKEQLLLAIHRYKCIRKIHTNE